jgi:hypothetical protein
VGTRLAYIYRLRAQRHIFAVVTTKFYKGEMGLTTEANTHWTYDPKLELVQGQINHEQPGVCRPDFTVLQATNMKYRIHSCNVAAFQVSLAWSVFVSAGWEKLVSLL